MKFHQELLTPLPIKQIDSPDGGNRYYDTPAGLFPSVTTIIDAMDDKTHLERWRQRVGAAKADAITQQAANRGTILHHAVEDYILHQKHEFVTPFDEAFWVQIKKMLDEGVETIYGSELAVYSSRLRAAGRTDLVAKYKGTASVVDFKTSTERKPIAWIKNYFIQTSCYAMMLYENYGIKVKQVVIMMATEDNDPIVYVKPVSDYMEDVVRTFTQYHKKFPGGR